MKKYYSKIGIGILLFLIIVIGGLSLIMIYQKAWAGLAINIGVSIFIGYIFSTTYYVIKNRELKVKSGIFVNKTIEIDSIKEISESRNPISSPANSLDRLEIIYNNTNSILISPKDKTGFISHLRDLIPNIIFDLDSER